MSLGIPSLRGQVVRRPAKEAEKGAVKEGDHEGSDSQKRVLRGGVTNGAPRHKLQASSLSIFIHFPQFIQAQGLHPHVCYSDSPADTSIF